GLIFFLETNAQLIGPNGPVAGEGAQSCTDYPTCSSFVPYWELTYRCSFCQPSPSPSSRSSSPTPTPTACELGTAFGYGTNPRAITLNSQSPLPKTCNRW